MDNRLKLMHKAAMLAYHARALHHLLDTHVGKELDENVLWAGIVDIQKAYEALNVQYDLHIGVDPFA